MFIINIYRCYDQRYQIDNSTLRSLENQKCLEADGVGS